MFESAHLDRVIPWIVRLAWVGVLVFGGAAVDVATSDRADAVRALARSGGAVVWVLGVAAMAFPSVVTLTATRIVVPLSVPVAVATWIAGADDLDAAAFLGAAVVATLAAFSGELGQVFVQASAYGEEERHLLRPPAAYSIVTALTWALWAACLLAGPLLLADRSWIAGGAISAAALAGAVWAVPRWHRLARRWLVVVPVGVVVHDHLVLAETLMLRRHEIAGLRLAPADTDAADLTGPAAGHAIEISTSEAVTAIVAPTPRDPRGSVIHLTACLVSPTRPGRALRSAGSRRLPIG